MNATSLNNKIRSPGELCKLNTSLAWRNADRSYSPAVSRFTLQELRSGIPFYVENEPVRFSRRPSTKSKDGAEGYALRWMLRFNRWLEKGLFDAKERPAA